ncbi:MAG: hypothetical protein NTW08_04045 [Gammaproteobacteria bacterium]|nr:hypothetical protein [Gammaproteobacteria bacterium]
MMRLNKTIKIMLVFCFLTTNSHAALPEPDAIGNFSLPRSQRPAAFFSFGSNILNPGQLQGRFKPNLLKGNKLQYIGSNLDLLFGTSTRTSLLLILPTTPSETLNHHHVSGFGDMGIQGQYAVYQRISRSDTEQASVIARLSAPTGTQGVSYNTASYFIGGTYNHSFVDWIWFAAPGVLLFDHRQDRSKGPSYYYEVGVGRNISSQPGRYICAWFLELNGQYDQTSTVPLPEAFQSNQGKLLDGNILYFSPSLWFSTPKWIIRTGFSIPIEQHWANPGTRVDYYAGAGIAYTFI